MFGRGNKEPKKPGKDADVLEIEEYEKRKNRITVNIYDKPAKTALIYGGLDFLAAVIAMIWNFANPIKRMDYIPGFEGWFFGFNVYRVTSAYLLIAAIIIFGMIAIKLYRQSKEASPELQRIREISLFASAAAIAMQPVSAVVVTVQAVSYFTSFN